MILPPRACDGLMRQLRRGSEGIFTVQHAMTQVDSRSATAQFKEDEMIVKGIIENAIGFERVDQEVVAFMITFIGRVVENHLKCGIEEMKSAMAMVRMDSDSTAATFSSFFALDPPTE